MRRLRNLIMLLGVLALIAAACGDDDEGGEFGLVEDGVLTVCTDAPYKPMEFEQDGEFTGFDIELMRAIASDMELDLKVVNSGFDPITSGTAMVSGQCDIAAASITITDDREQNIDFSDPYFKGDQSLLVKKGSGITTLSALSGRRIAVQAGTTGEAFAEGNAPADADIVSFDDPGSLFLALEAGDAAAVLQDVVVNEGRALDDDTVEVVERYPTSEFYGFAVQETGSEALLARVNQALGQTKADGTYDSIFNDWFG